MHSAPTYGIFRAYGAASVPSEIVSVAGKIVQVETGDIFGVLSEETVYSDYRTGDERTAPAYSLFFPLGAQGTLFPNAAASGVVHTGDAEYQTALSALAPYLSAGAYDTYTVAEFKATNPSAIIAGDGASSGKGGKGGKGKGKFVGSPGSLKPGSAGSAGPRSVKARGGPRAPVSKLPTKNKEFWKNPVFWALVGGGVLVVGGITYVAVK